MDDDVALEFTGDQVIWGAAEMFVSKHGARAADLVIARAWSLKADGEEVAGALYLAIADRIHEMTRSGATH